MFLKMSQISQKNPTCIGISPAQVFSYNFGEKFVDYLTYRASMNGCFCHSFRCLITTYTLTLCFASRNIQFTFSLFWSRKTTSSISNEVLLLDTLRNVFHVTVTAAVYFSRCSFLVYTSTQWLYYCIFSASPYGEYLVDFIVLG